jgi:hypothetical protein
MNATLAGLVLVGGGTLALALVTHSARDLGAWLRHALVGPLPGEAGRRARAFWEAASRSAILLGALGATFGFAAFLASGEGSLPVVERLGEQVFGPPVLGLVLAALCALPASRRAAPAASASEGDLAPRAGGRWLRVETGIGYALFLALLVSSFPVPGGRPGLRPVDLLLHAPAWLAVAAGAVAITLYLGDVRRGRSVTLGLAVAGGGGALLGLLQAFHGFAIARIETVAGGLVFALSAGVATLVGLGAVAFPLEDRAVAEGEGQRSRLVGYGISLGVVLLVAVAWLMVSTPMKIRP